MGKPSGLRTARKHVKNRRNQVWADLDYKKAHLGTRWKANPFGGASHAKGIVLEKVSILLGFTKRCSRLYEQVCPVINFSREIWHNEC